MENTKVGWTDLHMQLTEPRESKDGYKLQEFLEFFDNVTLWWCKWVIHKRISIICFALRHMSIVSANIQRAGLPPTTAGNFAGQTAIASGFGRTTQSKCVDPFNSYSADKQWLL